MAEKKSALQQAFIDYVQSIQPTHDAQTRTDLEKVRAAMQANRYWHEQDEWRISTYFDTKIEMESVHGKDWFKVRVECDMQEFICRCPNLEKAYLFSRFYRHLIVSQFYSVGPPWA